MEFYSCLKFLEIQIFDKHFDLEDETANTCRLHNKYLNIFEGNELIISLLDTCILVNRLVNGHHSVPMQYN